MWHTKTWLNENKISQKNKWIIFTKLLKRDTIIPANSFLRFQHIQVSTEFLHDILPLVWLKIIKA